MNTLVHYFYVVRRSVPALLAVVLCMVFAGWYWSGNIRSIQADLREQQRLEKLHKEGFVEVIVEGFGKTKKDAENDAKRRASEKAIGGKIEFGTIAADKSEQKITDAATTFSHDGSLHENIGSSGTAEFRSIDYLKHWQTEDGEWHVQIKAVIKSR